MKNASETLVCQLTAITDYVCQSSSLDIAELRALAGEFHHATMRVETEIAKPASGHPSYEGMFG
jgi:hypothetical protein